MQHRINKECLLHVLVKNHKKPEQLTSYCTAEFGKSMTGNVSMCKDSDCFWDSARLCWVTPRIWPGFYLHCFFKAPVFVFLTLLSIQQSVFDIFLKTKKLNLLKYIFFRENNSEIFTV